MHPLPEIVVVGSHAPGLFVRVQRVPVAGETVMGWDYQEPVDGGKGSNQAIAAARLGARVKFVGCVGQDRLGDDGERWLRDAGVDTSALKRSPTAATVGGFVILDQTGVPAIVVTMGANGDLTEQDVDLALAPLRGAKVMLTQFEIYPRVAVHAARAARDLGMLTILNPAPATSAPVEGLAAAAILTPNETEAKTLLHLDPGAPADPAQMAVVLRQQSGAGTVLITLGERGVVGADAGGTWQVPAPAVDAVDTTGAGDAFNAGLAAALVWDLPVRAAAAFGCGVASYSVTQPGTIPIYPDRPTVERFIAQHGLTP